MLKLVNKFHLYFILLFCSCLNTSTNGKLFREKAEKTVGKNDYEMIYKSANDSIKSWIENQLGYYQYLNVSKNYFVDSLLCFNSNKDRFVSSILMQQLLNTGVADDIEFFYGEKINNKWYFFEGANIFLPREMYQKDIHTPLTYKQLHEIALKEVYDGYLTFTGKINEEWFTQHFEGGGWCSTCKTRKEYEQVHLEKVRNNWMWRQKPNS